MIIRSQNKKGIINFNNIDTIGIEPNYCGCDVAAYNGTRESCVKLGEYSTEKKALKVLDMIQEAYSRMEDIKCGAVQAQKYDSLCFQIPDDEDVEV